MHEWALAEAVAAAAAEIAKKEGIRKIVEVRIKVGELQRVEPDLLRFALLQLRSGKLENAAFSIEMTSARLRCRVCENTWIFSREELDEETAEAIHFIPEVSHSYLKCPKCSSPDFEILEGRGVWLESIRGVK